MIIRGQSQYEAISLARILTTIINVCLRSEGDVVVQELSELCEHVSHLLACSVVGKVESGADFPSKGKLIRLPGTSITVSVLWREEPPHSDVS